MRLSLHGSSDLSERTLNLSGDTALLASGPPETGGTSTRFNLPFTLGGSWDQPEFRPDSQILLRQSNAAAPLFRDRVSAAARALVDRLTGHPQSTDRPDGALPATEPAKPQ